MYYTGQPGWGIAWYINNTIVPELVVERGRTYTFLIRGGNVSSDDANYHPFYITDSMNGGRLLNTPQQRMVNKILYNCHNNPHINYCNHSTKFCEHKINAYACFFLPQTETVYAGFNNQDNVTAGKLVIGIHGIVVT